MARAPKILYVDNDSSTFVSHRLDLAKAAHALGFEVHVAVPLGNRVNDITAAGLHVHNLKITRAGYNPFSELRLCLTLFSLFRNLQPDLIHLLRIKPALYGGIAARLTRVPAAVYALTGLGYVFSSTRMRARLLRPLLQGTLKLAFSHPNQRVLLQNPDDRNVLVSAKTCKFSDTIIIRGSGVNAEQYTPVAKQNRVPLVVLASRMLWEKGIREFVLAAEELKRGGTDARFALVGAPDPANPGSVPIEQLERWQREQAVEWWGWQPNMGEVFAMCDVMCLPSAYGEGVPRVLIEAAACGLPIVTTDSPGCREIVRHGENGFLVPVRDPHALATALRRLIENGSLRERLGANSREIAIKEFALGRVIAETCAMYRELLAHAAVVRST